MSAYTRAYQGLVKGGMSPAAAAQVLTELRQDIGAELADVINVNATAEYANQPGDSRAIHRRRKTGRGAASRAARWVLAATTPNATIPAQRNTGSTT